RRWKELLQRGPARKVLENSNTFWREEIPAEIEDLLTALIEQVRAVLLKSLIDRGDAIFRLLATFDEHLRERKLATAALRFDDITRALSTASLLGDLDDVFFRLDGRIQHLLFDEFQDTSLAQWQVLRPLAQEVVSHGTGDRSLFLVGDVKQAIYGWRGGVADIFDTLDEDLPGLSWRPLNRSWRSSPIIIKTVNFAFEDLPANKALVDDQRAAHQWQKGFKPHKTAKKELPGYARLEVAPEPEEGEKGYDSVFRRAADLVSELASACPCATIGVLTRRNEAVGRMIYELRRRQVPASEEGGNPVTDSAAVGIVLSLLRLADHPGDSIARFHVASSPLAGPLQLDDTTRSAALVAARVRRELVAQGYGTCVLRWSEMLGPHCDAREARRLRQLVHLARRHDASASLRADDFVAFVESERVEDPASVGVRVMTIHKAKGLEFDIVVLPELDQRLVGQTPAVLIESPSPTLPPTKVVPYASEVERRAIPELEEMAATWRAGQVRESLSLLYVALTRAVHGLYMIIEPRDDKYRYPSTFAGLLRSSLAQAASAEAGKVLFDTEDGAWYAQRPWAAPAPKPPAESVERIALTPSRKRRRGLPRTSPSAMEGGSKIQLADLMRLETGALQRGSIIHALFEQVGWLDDGMPGIEALRAAARTAGAGSHEMDGYIEQLQQMLANEDVRQVLTRSSYARPELRLELYRELPFAVRDDKGLLTGAMDRVVVRRYGDAVHDIEVLDYKTDRVEEADFERRVEHYRPQLDAYCRAASRLFRVGEQNVGARLIFVGMGRVVAL
ncbi:MAG: UvrD-helicase domain-containing protein, partial [Myxococcota bacterium]